MKIYLHFSQHQVFEVTKAAELTNVNVRICVGW